MTKDPSPYQVFLEDVEKKATAEEKVEFIVEFMRASLAQKGVPRFRDFWEARKLFHEVFKECKAPTVKATMWEQLGGLTAEARQIKEILDERSKFAVEQIELAVAALSKDVEREGKSDFSVPKNCHALQKNVKRYKELQGQIHFYGTLFDRLKALRGEVIATDMRVKQKNRLLKELTAIGDRFIPQRKALIEEVSDLFADDVRLFVKRNFEGAERKAPPHVLREEIKALQLVAKEIALSSRSFKEVREMLSKCWEELKKVGEEKRAEYEEKKGLFEENEKAVLPEVEAFLAMAAGEGSRAQIDAEHGKVVAKLRALELDGRVRHKLFKQVDGAHEAWVERNSALEAKKEAEEAAAAQKRMEEFRKAIDGASRRSVETLVKVREELVKDGLHDMVIELDLALLRKKTKQGEEVFDEWVALEEMLRERVEALRKEMGRSGFDFGQAMALGEQMDAAKGWLSEVEETLNAL